MRILFMVLLISFTHIYSQPLPAQTQAPAPPKILGRGVVTDAGWTADGQTLVVASATGLWLYDANNLTAEPTFLPSEHGWIRSMALSPRENLAITGHDDGFIVFTYLGESISTKAYQAHLAPVIELEFSVDGNIVVSLGSNGYSGGISDDQIAESDQTVRVWTWSADEWFWYISTTFVIRGVDYDHVSISPDNLSFAVSGTIFLFDVSAQYTIFYTLELYGIAATTEERRIFFSRDNQYYFDAGLDRHNRTTDDLTQPEKNVAVYDMVFSPTKDNFAAITHQPTDLLNTSGMLSIWDITTPTPVAVLGKPTSHNLDTNFTDPKPDARQVAFHPNGEQVVVTYYDSSVLIWDIASQTSQEVVRFDNPISTIFLSAQGNKIGTQDLYSGVKICDSAGQTPPISLPYAEMCTPIFSPDGESVIYSTLEDKTLQIRRIDVTTKTQEVLFSDEQHKLCSWALQFSPDGKSLVWLDEVSVHQLDLASGLEILHEGFTATRPWRGSFNTATEIFAIQQDYSVKLFDTATTKEIHEFSGISAISDVALAENLVAVSGRETPLGATGGVEVWDMTTYELLFQVSNERWLWNFPAVAFSPDGKTLAYSSSDGNIYFVDTTTWQTLRVLDGDYGVAIDIEFSADGSELAAGYESGVILVWDIQ